MKCTSCNKEMGSNIKFPCPKCGNSIARCDRCRNLSIVYECPKCRHRGP